jgi:hypothetical protein
MPAWYTYTLDVSAALGAALLSSLLVKNTREFIFTEGSKQP